MTIRSPFVLLLCSAALLAMPAYGAVFSIPDGDYAALRRAIQDANSNDQPDTITLATSGNYRPSGNLGLQTIQGSVAIYGQGATINGELGEGSTIFAVASSGNVIVSDLNIINVAYQVSEAFHLGGVVGNQGDMLLRNVTIADTEIGIANGSLLGVAVGNSGSLRLENVTLSGNQAHGATLGSAIYNGGSIAVFNSTITDNSATQTQNNGARAIEAASAQDTSVANTILADNAGGNCNVPVNSGGGNIDDDGSCDFSQPSDQTNVNPALQPLANNGGNILTRAFGANSPAYNSGNDVVCTVVDARGVVRAQAGGVGVGGHCDTGAYERRVNVTAFTNAITGSWFDPSQPGHGLMVEILPPGNRIFITWFVFDAAGNSDWIQANGTITGDVAKLTAYRVTGGAFPPAFDPDKTNVQYWGTVSIVLDSCTSGAFAWTPNILGYSPGGMPLTRLTQVAGLSCN